MYIVAWDDHTGQRHEQEFEHLEDAELEVQALEESALCEWVELVSGP